MLEDQDGVIAAFPDGDSGVVEVLASKADVLTQKAAKKLIDANKDFTVKSFDKKVVAKPAKKPAIKKNAKPVGES